MPILTGVPRAAVPARRVNARGRLLIGAVVTGPVLAAAALALAAGRAGPVRSSAVGHDRAFAQLAAQDYLAARATPLPFAQGVDPSLGRASASPDGVAQPLPYRALAWRSAVEGAVAGRHYEVDTFLVATTGALWHLSIEVLDTAAGPVLGADPSLQPDPEAPPDQAQALTYAPLAGGQQAELGPGATQQVQAWGEAYVDGDSPTLYRLTGDTRPAAFASLQGWTFDRLDVTSAVVKGDRALAQVQVVMHLAGQPASSATSSYDLLLGDLGQTLPFVQAWGPAGSGPTLTPFQQAVGPAPAGAGGPAPLPATLVPAPSASTVP